MVPPPGLRHFFTSVVLCAVGVVAAAQQGAQPPKPVAAGTGLIAGRVVEAGSQIPVAEAIVTLWDPKNERQRVMVDAQGRFAFTGLIAGQYRVTTAQFDYLGGAFGMSRPEGDSSTIDLADGQRVTDATIPMWRLAAITGRIVDEAGEPMVGIRVFALQRSVRNGEVQLTPVFDGGTIRLFTTDDRGAYRVSLLPPGSYTIAVPSTVSTFPVEVVQNALDSRIDLGVSETSRLGDPRYLQIGNQILATMTGRPIPPARDGSPVTVYETTFYPGATAVDQATVMSLAAGETRSGIDVQLVAKPTVRLSGQVLGPEGPLPLIPFRLVRAGGTAATESYGLEVATGVTDARGQFLLLGVPRGSYILRLDVSRPAPSPGARPVRLSADRALTVGDADVADILVNAHPWATVSGHVEVRGQPTAASAMMLTILGSNRGYEIRIDNDYGFSTALPPGRYLVLLHTAEGVCVSTSGGKDISDDLLEVADRDIADVLIVCGGTHTRISGAVRDDRGQRDLGARVVVFSTDRRFWSGPVYRQRRNASKAVAMGGTYDISDLPPGEYFIVAIADMETAEWELAAFRDKLIPSAVKIVVGPGEARALDLRSVVIR